MLVFAMSDKGGTGRSVTCANIAYQCALAGGDTCYVDFDLGSPTSASVFELTDAMEAAEGAGLHTFLRDGGGMPRMLDVWAATRDPDLQRRPLRAGRLALVPGDRGRGEFAADAEVVRRCVELLLQLEEEFAFTLVDLSAGRTYAIETALRATAELGIPARWLAFHRWTHQHIRATHGLVYGERGILKSGGSWGHGIELEENLRFVRAAVPDPTADHRGRSQARFAAWLQERDHELTQLANRCQMGRSRRLGTVPFDPLLQWSEQIITQRLVDNALAAPETLAAFVQLSRSLADQDQERWRLP